MNKSDKIRSIIASSATPASDLLVMVEDGEITAHEATKALKQSNSKSADVHSVAAAEIEYMRRNDI